MPTHLKEVKTIYEIGSEPMTIQDRINTIVELDKLTLKLFKEISEYKWDINKDSRVLFFKFITEFNTNAILQLGFQAESIKKVSDKDWLKNRLPHLAEMIDSHAKIEDYANNRNTIILNQLWDNLMLSYFIEFETRVRNIVREIGAIEYINSSTKKKKKSKYLNGSENFRDIINGLENYLQISNTEFEVSGIFAAIRNTIHNSGIYFSTYFKDSTYYYKNTKYTFVHGTPVSFLSFELKIKLLEDLLVLFSAIIKNEKVRSIKQVKDPLADIVFK